MRERRTMTKAEERKRKSQFYKFLRLFIQLVFFILMPGSFVAGFAGVKYLFTSLSQGNVIEFTGFVKTLLALSAFTIVFGRFFCGYICAFGTTGDVVHGISGILQAKLLKRKKVFRIPDKAACFLQKLKYLNLAAIIIMCTFGLYSRLSGTSIWDVFSRLARGQAVPSGYTVGSILLIITVVGMALEERFFCQFLCPMGAVFALLPVLPFSSLERAEANCAKNCKICKSTCPAHLKLDRDGKREGECIACGKCGNACPKGNISSGLDRLFRKKWIGVLVKAGIFMIIGYSLGF